MNQSELPNLDALQARVENAVRFFFDQQRNIMRGEQLNSSTAGHILTQNIITGNSSRESWSINLSEEITCYDHYNYYFYAIFFFMATVWIIVAGIYLVKKLCESNRTVVCDYISTRTDSHTALLPPGIAPHEDQPFVPTANDITEEQYNRMENEDKQLVQTENDAKEEQTHAINNEHLPLDLPTNDITPEQRTSNDDEDQQLLPPTKDVTGEQNNRNYGEDQQVVPSVNDVNREQNIPMCCIGERNNRRDNESETIETGVDIVNNPEINDSSSSGTVTDETISSNRKNEEHVNKNNKNSSGSCKTEALRGNKSSSSNEAENNINIENEDNNFDGSGETCCKAGHSPISENKTSMNTSDDNKAITTENSAETINENVNEEDEFINMKRLFYKIKDKLQMVATQIDTKVDLQSEDQKESETFELPKMETINNVQVNSPDKSTESKNDIEESSIKDSPKSQNVPEKKSPDHQHSTSTTVECVDIEKSKPKSLEFVFEMNLTKTFIKNRTNETKVEENDSVQVIEAIKSEDSSGSRNKEDEVGVIASIVKETSSSPGGQDLETGEVERKNTDHGLNKKLEREDCSEQATEANCETTHDSSKNEEEKGDESENPGNTDKKNNLAK